MTRTRLHLAAAVALLGLAAAGCTHPAPTAAAAPSVPVTSPAQVVPADVDIPSLGVHSTLIATGLNPDHTVQVPPLSEPKQASWFSYSPVPGQPGPAVLLGHVNSQGVEGVFGTIHTLAPGADVDVTLSNGQVVHFAVDHVQTASKQAFPTSEVYGNTPGPELRLITCGGPLDAAEHNYLDNVIVFAKEAT